MSSSRDDTTAASSPTPSATAVEIRVDALNKSFDENHVLRGVDLEIYRGEMVTIVGGSGCGKTVLLEHLFRHLKPDSGRVLVADHDQPAGPLVDIDALSEDELDRIRVHWAIVFQRNALFSGSVFDNIALWLREIKHMKPEAIQPIANRVVEAVGLNPTEVLDKDRDDLSGGMAKRIAIARALAMEPMLMFFDEPTTGLDPLHAAMIQDLIAQTHNTQLKGEDRRTTVIVTHDKDLLRRLRPRIVMLHEGKVFFDGPFSKFEKSDSPIVRPYFDLMPVLQQRTFRK